ncbi:hypothetical protein Tco_1429136 [Tanacetum coccineum]
MSSTGSLKHTNFDIKTAGDHRKVQLNELNELRDHAYENSLIYKEKTKRIHDSKIKNRVFNVGDRVLLFNSRLKIFSGKLKTRWSGPFTVTQVFPYGTVELSQNSGLKNDFVMSDSEHSIVTYTSIFSDDGSLDVGSLGVIVLGYDGLRMMQEDPYAYVQAAMQEPPPPDFVLEPVYPEFMPPEDDVLPAEEQPLPATVSPNADSPGYITESGLEEDSEEDDEDPKEDLTDNPTDRDDDEEEEEQSSGDDADDKEEDEGEDEEEEHLAPADSVPPPAYHTTAMK